MQTAASGSSGTIGISFATSPGTAARSCDSSSSMIVRLVWVPRSPEWNPQSEAGCGGSPAIPDSKFRSDTGLMIGDGRRETWSVHFRRLVCRRIGLFGEPRQHFGSRDPERLLQVLELRGFSPELVPPELQALLHRHVPEHARLPGNAGEPLAGHSDVRTAPAWARPEHPQFTNVPMTRAMLCAISLSSGNDSMPITEYPRSHGIR